MRRNLPESIDRIFELRGADKLILHSTSHLIGNDRINEEIELLLSEGHTYPKRFQQGATIVRSDPPLKLGKFEPTKMHFLSSDKRIIAVVLHSRIANQLRQTSAGPLKEKALRDLKRLLVKENIAAYDDNGREIRIGGE